MVYNLNVSATILNKRGNGFIGASLFVPIGMAWDLYEVVLDVRSFPSWAPGVRRVEVLKGPVGPGMVSEWEVSVLGLRRKIQSVLEEAEAPRFLRWTYDGPARGWGECVIMDRGYGTLVEFRTELRPAEPALEKLMRTITVQNVATNHLKRVLAGLGRAVSGDSRRARVGPLEELSASSSQRLVRLCGSQK